MSGTDNHAFPSNDTPVTINTDTPADLPEAGPNEQDAQQQQSQQTATHTLQQIQDSIHAHGFSRPTIQLLQNLFGADPQPPAPSPTRHVLALTLAAFIPVALVLRTILLRVYMGLVVTPPTQHRQVYRKGG